ncbi:MAG TPA: hypothetical protein VFQ91_13010 [Bryobacteraceae bacterium]|nr:hypothetical protein [Bryobacteraceae bacterium]
MKSILLFAAAALAALPAPLSLERARIVAGPSLPPAAKKAVAMLIEEVERRTLVHWSVQTSAPEDGNCLSIAVAAGMPAEGYRIKTGAPQPGCRVALTGADARGVLFGAGRLLRELRMSRGSVSLPEGWNIESAPKYPVRGHQIGYRSTNNTYDAWSVAEYEQYIRDMAVFGSNTVELTGTGMDSDGRSPHFRMSALRMHQEISRLTAEYGLDFSIWLPATKKNYADPDIAAKELRAWEAAFRALPKLDAVFVPGGDPGHTEPRILMPFLEKATAVLKSVHPNAGIWVSPQGMDDGWIAQFYAELRKNPKWLAGVVHGPWVRVTMPEFRKNVPSHIPIRLYPDITHTLRCQYPLSDWDPAFAITQGREPINPLPVRMTEWFGKYAPGSVGFVSYSDGSNDDVNKIIWSALAWDPSADSKATLREFSRYFLNLDATEGIFGLEQNWQGPLEGNAGVGQVLARFQDLEARATPVEKRNWRFQQLLYRAYSDAYTQRRLRYERGLEEEARRELAGAETSGAGPAMDEAERVLHRAVTERVGMDLRTRIFALAEGLFQGLGAQFSVKMYGAAGWERGATLDTVDNPLNNRPWLLTKFDEIRKLENEPKRLAAIHELLHREDPGPGGYYDDLGDPARQPHFVPDGEAGQQGYAENLPGPLAWISHANSWKGRPIRMRYTGLDPDAEYRLRVVYGGEAVAQEQPISLTANDGIVVHGPMKKPLPIRPVEFDIPREATRTGALELRWEREEPPSGRLRGAQVSEVWLIKKTGP